MCPAEWRIKASGKFPILSNAIAGEIADEQ
jgi:hypothetical protein